jgi:hypothetical protein
VVPAGVGLVCGLGLGVGAGDDAGGGLGWAAGSEPLQPVTKASTHMSAAVTFVGAFTGPC